MNGQFSLNLRSAARQERIEGLVSFVTMDARLLKAFPKNAVALAAG